MKRCSPSLVNREMQIKTTMRYHFTSTRIAWNKQKRVGEMERTRQGCGEIRTLTHCWWECKLVQPLPVWLFLKKLNMELPYDPAIPLLGIYLEKTIIWKDTCTPIFNAVLFTISKVWKQPKYSSMYEWITKKKCGIYTMEYYSAIKKNKILPFATTLMALEALH